MGLIWYVHAKCNNFNETRQLEEYHQLLMILFVKTKTIYT